MKGMPVTLMTNSPAATCRRCRCMKLSQLMLCEARNACAVGVCSSRTQCKDDEASDKTDLRHEHADTPKLKSVPECLRKKC